MISFDEFWSIVPRKAGSKPKARKIWDKLSKKKQEIIIEDYPKRYINTDKAYIPYPTTYLNGEYWECEIEVIENERKHGAYRNDSRAKRVHDKLREIAERDTTS